MKKTGVKELEKLYGMINQVKITWLKREQQIHLGPE